MGTLINLFFYFTNHFCDKKKMDHENNVIALNTPALPCDSHVETKSDAGCERSC
jgi:hypothetical protein